MKFIGSISRVFHLEFIEIHGIIRRYPKEGKSTKRIRIESNLKRNIRISKITIEIIESVIENFGEILVKSRHFWGNSRRLIQKSLKTRWIDINVKEKKSNPAIRNYTQVKVFLFKYSRASNDSSTFLSNHHLFSPLCIPFPSALRSARLRSPLLLPATTRNISTRAELQNPPQRHFPSLPR